MYSTGTTQTAKHFVCLCFTAIVMSHDCSQLISQRCNLLPASYSCFYTYCGWIKSLYVLSLNTNYLLYVMQWTQLGRKMQNYSEASLVFFRESRTCLTVFSSPTLPRSRCTTPVLRRLLKVRSLTVWGHQACSESFMNVYMCGINTGP